MQSNPFLTCDLSSLGPSNYEGRGVTQESKFFDIYMRQQLPKLWASALEAYYIEGLSENDFWLSSMYPTVEFDLRSGQDDNRNRMPIYTAEFVRSEDIFNGDSAWVTDQGIQPCSETGNGDQLEPCNRPIRYTTFKTGVRYVDGHLEEAWDRGPVFCLEYMKRLQDVEPYIRNVFRAMTRRVMQMRSDHIRYHAIISSRSIFTTPNQMASVLSANYGLPTAYNPSLDYYIPSWQAFQTIFNQMIYDAGDGVIYANGEPCIYAVTDPFLWQQVLQSDPNYKEIWLNTGQDRNSAYGPVFTQSKKFHSLLFVQDSRMPRIKVMTDTNGNNVLRFVGPVKTVWNADGSGVTTVADPLYHEAEFGIIHLTFRDVLRRTVSSATANTWSAITGLNKGDSPDWATVLQGATGEYVWIVDNPLPLTDKCEEANNPLYTKGLFVSRFRQGTMLVNPQRHLTLLVPLNNLCHNAWGLKVSFCQPARVIAEGCPTVTEYAQCTGCEDGQFLEYRQDSQNIVDICREPRIARFTLCRKRCYQGAFTINYTTEDITAVAGTHYTATAGALTWADDETGCKTIEVPVAAATGPGLNGLTFRVRLTLPAGVSVDCNDLIGIINQPCYPCPDDESPITTLPLPQP